MMDLHIDLMVKRWAAARPRTDDGQEAERLEQARTDSLADDLDRMFAALKLRWGHRAQQLRPLIEGFAKQTGRFNLVQLNRQTQAVLGIDLIAHEPWLKDEVALFTRENVGLIKDVGETAIARIERAVTDGVRKGDSTKAIAKAIQEEMGITERRATLIAVDQIGKFNGALSRLRQEDAGIEEYIWRTCKDMRVRPAHRPREGQRYKWSDPPSDGNPGEPVRCRCHAEPVLDRFADLLPPEDPVDWEAIGNPARRRR
jgi:SPP1 gp7 family putative phage head morphogenesis protein